MNPHSSAEFDYLTISECYTIFTLPKTPEKFPNGKKGGVSVKIGLYLPGIFYNKKGAVRKYAPIRGD
jgi:hypothetical protein